MVRHSFRQVVWMEKATPEAGLRDVDGNLRNLRGLYGRSVT
jgi:hypothetical protein